MFLVNATSAEITIHMRTQVARIELLEEAAVTAVSEASSTVEATPSRHGIPEKKQKLLWEAVEQSGDKLSP